MMKRCQVVFQPSGRRGEVGIESVCGGKTSCGKCLIRIESDTSPDALSAFTDEERKLIDAEKRADGLRLACAARLHGNAVISIPEHSRTAHQMIRKEPMERKISLNPAVRLFPVTLSPTSQGCISRDDERLAAALSVRFGLEHLTIDDHILTELPDAIQKGNGTITAALWMEREILAVFPGEVADTYGIAVDIGSTTVAAYLCNLATGDVIETGSLMNPQVAYGDDVMARITYVMEHEDGLETLRRAIVESLNELIGTVTANASLSPTDILELTVVGNTAMHHIFLGLDPKPLGVAPFTPAVLNPLDIKARDLGLAAHLAANVHILPIEAGFVGADNVGVLIAEEPYRKDEMTLIIDVGTNGELILGNRERLLSASCATGPALEGAHIRFGMRAAQGAIERILIDPETLDVSYITTGNEQGGSAIAARGICGSGIIDGVAELYRAGVIDRSGRFRSDLDTPRIRQTDGKREFVIAWPEETSLGEAITISQQDVRSVQLAKGALYAGAKLMMKKMGIEKLDRVKLAGAFGSYIDKQKAMILGMFPDCAPECVFAVGNAAGDGARIALLNRNKRQEAEEMARRVEYIELTLEQEFQKEFMAAMYIPHMSDPFPNAKC
jgi:uncharacterized 2Fe-2S/4Fe-4S cluster protein (DUF4445 family)